MAIPLPSGTCRLLSRTRLLVSAGHVVDRCRTKGKLFLPFRFNEWREAEVGACERDQFEFSWQREDIVCLLGMCSFLIRRKGEWLRCSINRKGKCWETIQFTREKCQAKRKRFPGHVLIPQGGVLVSYWADSWEMGASTKGVLLFLPAHCHQSRKEGVRVPGCLNWRFFTHPEITSSLLPSLSQTSPSSQTLSPFLPFFYNIFE